MKFYSHKKRVAESFSHAEGRGITKSFEVVLRIDTGGPTSIRVILNYSGTIVARIVYDIPFES